MAVAPRPSASPGPGRSFAPRSCAVRTVTRLGCTAAADAWACTECTVRAVRGPAASGAAEAGPTSATARPRAAATLTAIRDSTLREVREVMFAHLLVQHGLGRAGGEWPKSAIVAARAVRTGCPSGRRLVVRALDTRVVPVPTLVARRYLGSGADRAAPGGAWGREPGRGERVDGGHRHPPRPRRLHRASPSGSSWCSWIGASPRSRPGGWAGEHGVDMRALRG